MNKRVGIMSMQRIKNYGSFLQAYGLKKMIEELGDKVEFVDYHIDKPIIIEKNDNKGKFKKIKEVLSYKAKIYHKIQFIRHKREFPKFFDMLGMTNKLNYNPKLDTLVIGSDEVFNCVQKNPNVGYSLELFGRNNNAQKVITYAASFGNTTIEKLNKYEKENEISVLLNKFDSISVRDKNSYNIVTRLTDNKPMYNLDPVLMYDYMNKCDMIPTIKKNEKYIIVYAYNGRISSAEAKHIKEYAQKKECKIYSIGGAQECADKFINCNPFEVLAYFKNAELVITDTFHGSIFSIITNRNFLTMVRKSIGNEYGNEEKLTDLLSQLNLTDRIAYNIENMESILDKKIDYEMVNKILTKQREISKEYLKENL